MKRIFYASGSLVTSDRTAEAVLAYAQALAQRESSDTIDIPIFGVGGTTARAQLLIGPSSQVLVLTEMSSDEEFDDEETLLSINRLVEGLLRPKGRPVDPDDPGRDAHLHTEPFNSLATPAAPPS